MATVGLQILFSAVFVSFFMIEVHSKVERYAFRVSEKGTIVNEEVDVNVEEQTEVIRVPQHNKVDASEVMNDFDSGLSARRVPSTQDCFVSKLDPSFPSPQKMKLDMDQASKQALPDKVKVEKYVQRELGFANRSALPQRILDFCGSFPIYNVKEIPFGSKNASLSKIQGRRRKKRNHVQTEYHMCSSADGQRLAYCQNTYGFNFTQTCTYTTAHCYYIVNCQHQGNTFNRQYACNTIVHRIDYTGLCCKAICT